MVFKRRTPKTWSATLTEAVYPKGGWGRAVRYVQHRLQRLPGSPETIARGIAAGVFITFSPLLGLHMIGAAALAFVVRGNMIAALLATFIGNPITYVPIAASSLGIGYALLGGGSAGQAKRSILQKFGDASSDLWYNLRSVFTGEATEWSHLIRFWNEVFLPYLVGGLIAGGIFAIISFYLTVPVIRVYQNRRRGRLRDKLAQIKDRAVATAKRDGSKTED